MAPASMFVRCLVPAMQTQFDTRSNRGRQQPSQPPARTRRGKRKRATNHDHSSDEETEKHMRSPNLRQTMTMGAKPEESDKGSPFYDEEAAFWKIFDRQNSELSVPLKRVVFENFFTDLRRGNPDRTQWTKEKMGDILEEEKNKSSSKQDEALLRAIEDAWNTLLNQIYAQVSPSTFAQSSGWIGPQLGPGAIDCLRPPERNGLPIVLLDPAFAQFTSIIEQEPPLNHEYTNAARLAGELCLTMSKHFSNEKERAEKFHSIIAGFFAPEFPSFVSASYGNSHQHASILNRSGEAKLIVEYKNEPGNNGNVHMQGVRSFDAAAQTRPIDQQKQTGCPSFIACMEGPQILICGGFRDGGRSLVEPLSTWCIMMPDRLGKRQMFLAKHIYALKVSMRLLFNPSPLPATAIHCPRIYNQFKNSDGLMVDLTFMSPFNYRTGSPSYPLFLAKVKAAGTSDGNEEEVLVKLVQGNYGKDAHRVAAESGLAPKLYGVASLDGAPSAYIMEHLSGRAGWRHPEANSIYLPTREHFKKLQAEIRRLLVCLQDHQLVHGDLRPNNMFIRVQDDNVELRVVDWDWAGPQGTARYPIDLNPNADLPGVPNGKIHTDHDQSTIYKYFNQLKQQQGLY